ncbi:MAG: hypothetical protein A2X94_06395 [Bdellovibrionales bacterium GWB1_55_8]|nr:MAG: hypothetical protein A2X94_06395 [Bdellovibrionales bacterium GWB1_55_8]
MHCIANVKLGIGGINAVVDVEFLPRTQKLFQLLFTGNDVLYSPSQDFINFVHEAICALGAEILLTVIF